jgi:hypothetical protein
MLEGVWGSGCIDTHKMESTSENKLTVTVCFDSFNLLEKMKSAYILATFIKYWGWQQLSVMICCG